MKRKRRFQILFSGEHHYTDEEFMDKTDIFDEIMTEIFGCDWGCSMCMDFQGYEKVEAIPIQFLKEWSEQNEYDETKPRTIPLVLNDWEEWRKENETNNI